jgi:signal peptidase I
MWPSFYSGEYLLTDKLTYRFRDPERGEVVIFEAPAGARCPQELQCDFVKRVIGLPGEKLEIREGNVFINGIQLKEPYIASELTANTFMNSADTFSINLDGTYFVMGDNRSHSSDSRAWGPINKDSIIGKAWFRYWPPQKAGFIPQIEM